MPVRLCVRACACVGPCVSLCCGVGVLRLASVFCFVFCVLCLARCGAVRVFVSLFFFKKK